MTSQDILTKQHKISRIGRFALVLFCLTQIYCSSPSVITDFVNPPVSGDYIVPPEIKDFSAANENEAWLVTREGKVFHFTEGGEKIAEAKFSEEMIRVFFLNANEGWALSERGQLWTTTNGGKDWNIKSLFEDGSIALHANRLIFADNKVGWLIGYFTILMTEDGGASWNMVYPTEQLGYKALEGQPISISIVNADVVWLGFSGGAVLKTTDRGKSWERIASPGNYDLQALKALNADECLVSG